MRRSLSRRMMQTVLLGLASGCSGCGGGGPSPLSSPAASVATPAATVVPATAPAVARPRAPEPGGSGCSHHGDDRELVVGPGEKNRNLGDVPVESLTAGDTVRVLWREHPYR